MVWTRVMSQKMARSNTALNRWMHKHKVTIQRLSDDLGLAYRTVWNAAHGIRRVRYETGQAISKYTDGKVTVEQLCSDRG